MDLTVKNRTARRIPGVDKSIKVMNIEEQVTAKVTELGDLITSVKGSVIVIGLMPIEEENKSAVIASMHGNSAVLTEAVAKVLSNDTASPIAKVISKGIAFANIYKMLGERADETIVKTND